MLLALENPKVDYLSLDVEGVEEDILSTIPWDEVDITVIGLEIIVKKNDERAVGEHRNSFFDIYDLLIAKDYILLRADWHTPEKKSMEAYFVKKETAEKAPKKVRQQGNVDFCEEPFVHRMCP